MEFLNQLLAGILEKFKAKNPKIYTLVMIGLVLIYLACDMLIKGGVFDDTSMLPKIIQYIDVVFMALFGSKTAPYLKEYLGLVSVQQVVEPDSWWTSLIDAFKMKSPVAFGVVATVLITFFVGSQYAIHFDLIHGEGMTNLLKWTSYADIAVLVLLGTRTGQYLTDHPPTTTKDAVSVQSIAERASYYD